MPELFQLTAHEISALIAGGKTSSREVTQSALAHIESVEPSVRAFLTITAEEALAQADVIDHRLAAGDQLSPLAGVPIALKDNLCTAGVRTTAGSRILNNCVPPYDATVVRKLRDAGMVFLGKVNLDEFAMGSSTENSAFQSTTNPWDSTCVPGGSSGGSAAAVAACEAPLALGSDTGGSIRQPASYCGLVGLKPTYGRVSRFGLIAYASSLDQIGPLSRTVEDSAMLLQLIAGPDEHDSTSAPAPVDDYMAACSNPTVKGLRIGVPQEYYAQGVNAEVSAAVRAAAALYESLGATVEECSLPSTDYALAAYYVVAPAECSSNLARFDGVRYGMRSADKTGHIGLMELSRGQGFGSEVKQRIMIGTYALSAGYYDAYYRRAQQVRTLIRNEFTAAFQKFDLLLTPTAPAPAFKLGAMSDPMEMKLADVCTIPVNMAGLPGISVPCGFVDGLPVGLQLIAAPFQEALLFRASAVYQQATNWAAMLSRAATAA